MTLSADHIIARFSAFKLHDSKIVSVAIGQRTSDGKSSDELRIGLDLIAGSYPAYAYEPADLVFLDCLYIRLDWDLYAKQMVGSQIGDTRCLTSSPLREHLEATAFAHNPGILTGYYHFHIELADPAGDLEVFARNFRITPK